MKLATLANFSLAITNGSHQPAGTIGKTKKNRLKIPKPAGIAVSSPASLKLAVTKLCGTRRRRPGLVTTLMRDQYAVDTERANNRRKAHMQADLDRKAREHLKKGIKFNNVRQCTTYSSPVYYVCPNPNMTFQSHFQGHGRASCSI
jgi:hypothetical protein